MSGYVVIDAEHVGLANCLKVVAKLGDKGPAFYALINPDTKGIYRAHVLSRDDVFFGPLYRNDDDK